MDSVVFSQIRRVIHGRGKRRRVLEGDGRAGGGYCANRTCQFRLYMRCKSWFIAVEEQLGIFELVPKLLMAVSESSLYHLNMAL